MAKFFKKIGRRTKAGKRVVTLKDIDTVFRKKRRKRRQ